MTNTELKLEMGSVGWHYDEIGDLIMHQKLKGGRDVVLFDLAGHRSCLVFGRRTDGSRPHIEFTRRNPEHALALYMSAISKYGMPNGH